MNRVKIAAIISMVVPALVLMLLSVTTQRVTAQGNARALYNARCASCHGVDGRGRTAKGREYKVHDLHELKEGDTFRIIARGKGKMPGYEKTLGEDKCRALAEFIRNGLQ